MNVATLQIQSILRTTAGRINASEGPRKDVGIPFSTAPTDEVAISMEAKKHHLIDQIVRHHNLEEPDSIARAIHAAGSVVLSIADPAAQAQAVTYLATRVGRDDAVIQGYLEDRARPPARGRSRSHGRSIA